MHQLKATGKNIAAQPQLIQGQFCSVLAQAEIPRRVLGQRRRGIAAAGVQQAIGQARQRGCGMVQLTSNKKRLDAHRFYERLGYRWIRNWLPYRLSGEALSKLAGD